MTVNDCFAEFDFTRQTFHLAGGFTESDFKSGHNPSKELSGSGFSVQRYAEKPHTGRSASSMCNLFKLVFTPGDFRGL